MRPLEAVLSGMFFIAIVAAAAWGPVWAKETLAAAGFAVFLAVVIFMGCAS
jgi:hypothetical protein